MIPQKPRIGPVEGFSYRDNVRGVRRHFLIEPTEVVVTFDPKSSGDVIRAVLDVDGGDVLSLLGENGPRGFAIFRVLLGREWRGLVRKIEQVSGVWNCMAALRENERTVYVIPDEVVVQFRPDVDEDAARRIIGREGSLIVVKQRTAGFYTVAVPEGRDIFVTIDRFSAYSEVVFAEASHISPNDFGASASVAEPYFPMLWGLNNTGQLVNGYQGTAGSDIRAVDAWAKTKGNASVIIVVIDTGVDLSHSDLVASILPRNGEDWDFSSAYSDEPMDQNGHGTHVSGIACAVENGSGIVGVAPNCRLMPLKIGLLGPFQERVDALNYVTKLASAGSGLRYVVNCSWGSNTYDQGVDLAVAAVLRAGVVLVAGVGNSGEDIKMHPLYPAQHAGVIAVAATDQGDVKWVCSNYGVRVDVCAPGFNILSAQLGGGWRFDHGTSMAAPHASGLAGLIWSLSPQLSNWAVIDKIKRGSDNVDRLNPGLGGLLGWGRINASRSL